jgi:putative inorganic carbon (HCO3(-)) transporter
VTGSAGSRLQAVGILVALVVVAFLGVALIYLNMEPQTILALIVGAGTIVLLLVQPILSVHLFTAAVYAENLVQSESGMTVMKAVGIIVVLGWALSVLTRRRLDVRVSPLLIFLALFIGWSAISMLSAFNTSMALERVLTFTQLGFVVVMFASVVNSTSRVKWVLRTIVGWTTIVSIHAMALYLLGVTDVASGIIRNRNGLGMFIDLAIVCAYLLGQMKPHPWERVALVGALPILFVVLAFTFSRTAYLALVLALFLVAYRLARTRGYLILAGSVLMLGLIIPLLPDAFYARVGTILPAMERQDDTVGLRVQRWKYAMRMIKDHPIVGVGPNNFVPVLARYGRGDINVKQGLVAHNTYLNVAAEMGLVGLALFLLMTGAAIREVTWIVRRFGSTNRDLVLASNAIEISLVVMLIEGLMGNMENLKALYVLFGLACSIGRLAILESRQHSKVFSESSTSAEADPQSPSMSETVPSLAP